VNNFLDRNFVFDAKVREIYSELRKKCLMISVFQLEQIFKKYMKSKDLMNSYDNLDNLMKDISAS
jgi:hypothetical protein